MNDNGGHDESWEWMTQQIEAFLEAWEDSSEPPAIGDFVPVTPTDDRRGLLTELVKVDIEFRLQRDAERTLEQYVADHPELAADDGVPADLIYEDFHLRRTNGHDVEAEDYCRRFPEQEDEFRTLLGLDLPAATISLHRNRKAKPLESGEQIGDFDILALLGEGAFAQVYLARQRSMQRTVALKVSADRGNEPQTLAQLDHPNIVRVHDQSKLPEQGLRLMYMEYAPGGTLHEVSKRVRKVSTVERDGSLLVESVRAALQRGSGAEFDADPTLSKAAWPHVVCRIGVQLAQALDYAHGHGVLHRDIKPANVLLSARGTPKLADFNISFSSQVEGSTPAAYFGGSLAYMSPEQLRACNPLRSEQADTLDGRSDLYSLAVLLWELLTGERPFHDPPARGDWSQMLEEMHEVRQRAPRRASGGDLVSGHIMTVLSQCLQPTVEQRPANGAEMARQLQLCLDPRAWKLMMAPSRGLPRWIVLHPLVTLLAAISAPNMPAAFVNLLYNLDWIKTHAPDAEATFWGVINFINSVAFPLGMVCVGWLLWPGLAALRKVVPRPNANRRPASQPPNPSPPNASPPNPSPPNPSPPNPSPPNPSPPNPSPPNPSPPNPSPPNPSPPETSPLTDQQLTVARRRMLQAGHYSAWVGVALWSLAGIAYPAILAARVANFPLREAFPLFLSSLLACGLMAAAYPFFAASLIAVRVLYPRLLRLSQIPSDEADALKRLSQSSDIYLLLAVGAPILVVLMLILAGRTVWPDAPAGDMMTNSGMHGAALVLSSVASIVGLAAAYLAHRWLQKDLASLCYALQPLTP